MCQGHRAVLCSTVDLILVWRRFMMLTRTRGMQKFLPNAIRFISSKSQDCQEYCRELVKKADYFNYLCCLPLPQPQQRFAFALHAFNVEVSLICDRAPTPQTANLRFQFWEDSVHSLFGGDARGAVNHSPIGAELSWAVGRFTGSRLSKHWLLRLLQARRNRSGDVAFQDCVELEEYAESTNAPIHYAIAEAFGLKSVELDHALSHLGKAQGLITHLRSIVPLANLHRVCILPIDLLIKHDLPSEIALRLCRRPYSASHLDDESITPKSVERLLDVSQALATRARAHALKALAPPSATRSSLPAPLRALLFLPAVPTCRLLRGFAECNFDPRHPRWLRPREGLMPLRVAWHAARGKVATVPS